MTCTIGAGPTLVKCKGFPHRLIAMLTLIFYGLICGAADVKAICQKSTNRTIALSGIMGTF